MPPRHFNATLRARAACGAACSATLLACIAGVFVTATAVAAPAAEEATSAGWTREPIPRLPDDPLTLTKMANAPATAATTQVEPAAPAEAAPAPASTNAPGVAPAETPAAAHADPPAEPVATSPKPASAPKPAPTKWGPTQIVIYKARRSLAVYRSGDFYREYPVVLGLNPIGRKRHADDARTPEGLYRVVRKRPHARWQYFLDLDYPNAKDRQIYAKEKAAGRIPDEDGSPFPIGGSIGIHGNDRADQQAAGLDWTKGCIALDPSDIAEVEALTPVGTPVWIVQ